MPNSAQPSAGTKLCWRCRERKPIRDFITKHHRYCKACWEAMNGANVVTWAAKQQQAGQEIPPIPQPNHAIDWVNAQANAPPGTGLTTTREGFNKYMRERNRRVRMFREQLKAQAQATAETITRDPNPAPEAKLVPDKGKLCRRCHRILPTSHYLAPWARICLACDGPPLA